MSVRLANPLLGDGSATRNHLSDIDPRALLLVAVGYVVTMLSVPVLNLGMLIWFAAYPVVMAPLSHVTYSRVFRKSLVTLPFILLIGVMNPLFDQRVAMTVCGVDVSAGWISFVSIIIRGLLSVQAALLLVYVCGFDGVCRAMGRLGLPSVMVTQLMMVSRYMRTLGEEAITMQRARQARGYGRKNYPVREWGPFIGQLLLRTVERGERVNRAMVARGFDGTFPQSFIRGNSSMSWETNSTVFLLIWGGVIFCLRYFDLSAIFFG